MSGGWIPGCTRTSLRILAGRGICAGIDFWTAWAYDGLASCLSSRLLIFSSSWKILLVRPVELDWASVEKEFFLIFCQLFRIDSGTGWVLIQESTSL